MPRLLGVSICCISTVKAGRQSCISEEALHVHPHALPPCNSSQNAHLESSWAGMDCIPRLISRAQTFDSLSSMANIAGYRSALSVSPDTAL